MKKIKGALNYWFETGMEGSVWVLEEDGYEDKSYAGMHIIENGDHLTIYNEDNKVIFNDAIEIDTETGKIPRPTNPSFKQQVALGFWIHWIQKGWQPDDWVKLFIREKKLRAELIKK